MFSKCSKMHFFYPGGATKKKKMRCIVVMRSRVNCDKKKILFFQAAPSQAKILHYSLCFITILALYTVSKISFFYCVCPLLKSRNSPKPLQFPFFYKFTVNFAHVAQTIYCVSVCFISFKYDYTYNLKMKEKKTWLEQN